MILGGDFNIDTLVPSKDLSRFQDLILSHDLKYIVNSPTRVTATSSKCLDNFLVCNQSNMCVEIVKPGFSDHYAQVLKLKCVKRKTKSIFVYKRYFSDENVKKFHSSLGEEDWVDTLSLSNAARPLILFLINFPFISICVFL